MMKFEKGQLVEYVGGWGFLDGQPEDGELDVVVQVIDRRKQGMETLDVNVHWQKIDRKIVCAPQELKLVQKG